MTFEPHDDDLASLERIKQANDPDRQVGIDELAEKVRGVFLRDGFAPDEIGLSTRDGVVVFVTSDRFSSMDDMDRQQVVWDLLKRSLTAEERRAVSIVVALTPKERSFHLADGF